jgi:alkylation response protein AidB-like acyl-CoA dehydrogenase
LETPFADLYGALADTDFTRFPPVEDGSPDEFRQWRRVALAAEVGAVARAAIRQTVDYVKLRRQFDRPIGSFQAIQHRLAECEALQHGIEALARWAAGTRDPAAAALAAAHAQAAAGRIAYDAQQFHGASGLTRESPLHFSTYRLRALQGELGGLAEQSLAAAEVLWPQGPWEARPGADWR